MVGLKGGIEGMIKRDRKPNLVGTARGISAGSGKHEFEKDCMLFTRID